MRSRCRRTFTSDREGLPLSLGFPLPAPSSQGEGTLRHRPVPGLKIAFIPRSAFIESTPFMKGTAAFLGLSLLTLSLPAQTPRTNAPGRGPAPVVSPEVHADRR